MTDTKQPPVLADTYRTSKTVFPPDFPGTTADIYFDPGRKLFTCTPGNGRAEITGRSIGDVQRELRTRDDKRYVAWLVRPTGPLSECSGASLYSSLDHTITVVQSLSLDSDGDLKIKDQDGAEEVVATDYLRWLRPTVTHDERQEIIGYGQAVKAAKEALRLANKQLEALLEPTTVKIGRVYGGPESAVALIHKTFRQSKKGASNG